ncbi:MAG: hypothetical protein GW886_16530 [Rhodobacterales bacterium]|nr:hypothetical protein [Rhodobacterales bacterium]
MSFSRPVSFCSDQRHSALCADLGARRRALQVNVGIIARQHGDAIAILVRRYGDKRGRASAARFVAAGVEGAPWSPSIARDLGALICGLAASAPRKAPARDLTRLDWMLDRLCEIEAQGDKVAALTQAIDALSPTKMGALTLRQKRDGQPLRGARRH